MIGREYRIQWTVSGTTSSATTFATVIATSTAGTEADPHIITTIDSAVNVLSQLDVSDRSDSTWFRYNNPTAGEWEMVFTTTPAQDWDTWLWAYDGNTEQEEDNEAVDTTDHTLSVTANASTDNLRIRLQFWEQASNPPTAATLRLNSPAPAATFSFSQYSDTTPDAGDTTTASFTGTLPSDITYQWQFRNSAQNAWSNVAGQTTRTLSVASNAPGGRQISIEMDNWWDRHPQRVLLLRLRPHQRTGSYSRIEGYSGRNGSGW